MAGAGEKAEAYKVKLGTSTIYPQTVSDAVVDTGSNQMLTESLKSIKKAADEAKNWSIKLQTYDSYNGIQTAVDVNKITPSSTFFLDGRYFANIAAAVTVSTHTVGFPVAVEGIEHRGVFNRIVISTGLHCTTFSDPLGSAIGIYCNPQINFAIGSTIATPVYGTVPISSSLFGERISKDSVGFNSSQFYLDALDTGGVRLNVGLPVLHISSGITYLPSEVNPILRGLKIGTGLTYEIRRPESEEEKFTSQMFSDADGGIVEIALSDQNVKQDKTDNKLKTTSKDIVGAINEVKKDINAMQATVNSLQSTIAALTNRVAALEKAATTTTTTTTVPPRTSTTTAGATGTPRAKANNWDEEDSDTSSLNKSVDDYINGETV